MLYICLSLVGCHDALALVEMEREGREGRDKSGQLGKGKREGESSTTNLEQRAHEREEGIYI